MPYFRGQSTTKLVLVTAIVYMTGFASVLAQHRVFSNNFGRQVFQDPNNPRLRFTLVPTFAGPFPVFQQSAEEEGDEGPSNHNFRSVDNRQHPGHFMSDGPLVFIPQQQQQQHRMFTPPPMGPPRFQNGPPPPPRPPLNQHGHPAQMSQQGNNRFFGRPPASASRENFGPPSTSTTPHFFVTSGPHHNINHNNNDGNFHNHLTFTNPRLNQNNHQQQHNQHQQLQQRPNNNNGGGSSPNVFFNPFLSTSQPLFPFHQPPQQQTPRFVPRPDTTRPAPNNFVGINHLTSPHVESSTSPTTFPSTFQLQTNQPPRFQQSNSGEGSSGEFQTHPPPPNFSNIPRPQHQQQPAPNFPNDPRPPQHQQQHAPNFANNPRPQHQQQPAQSFANDPRTPQHQPAPNFANEPRPAQPPPFTPEQLAPTFHLIVPQGQEQQFLAPQPNHGSAPPTIRPQLNNELSSSSQETTSAEFIPSSSPSPPTISPPAKISAAFPVGPPAPFQQTQQAAAVNNNNNNNNPFIFITHDNRPPPPSAAVSPATIPVITNTDNNLNLQFSSPQSHQQVGGSNFPNSAEFPRAPISFFGQGFADHLTPPTTPIFFTTPDIANNNVPPPHPTNVEINGQVSTNENQPPPAVVATSSESPKTPRPNEPFPEQQQQQRQHHLQQVHGELQTVTSLVDAKPIVTNSFPTGADFLPSQEIANPDSFINSQHNQLASSPPSTNINNHQQQPQQQESTETSREQSGVSEEVLVDLPRLVERPSFAPIDTLPPLPTTTESNFPAIHQHQPTQPPSSVEFSSVTSVTDSVPTSATISREEEEQQQQQQRLTTSTEQPTTTRQTSPPARNAQRTRQRIRKLRPRVQSPSVAAILGNLQKPLPVREDQLQRPHSTRSPPLRTSSATTNATTNNGRRTGATTRGRRPTRFRRPQSTPATEANLQDISETFTQSASRITDTLPSRPTSNAHLRQSTTASLLTSASSPPEVGQDAKPCNPAACHLPNCFCGGNKFIPGGLKASEIPQMILLTFDDSVNEINYQFYSSLLNEGRTNPNDCPISATFYVSHEWTDYGKIQTLYALGHEIASHSISHSDGASFSQDRWLKDIYGQKRILSALGGIKLDDIRGMRAPFLQGGGNKQFAMLHDTNFTYDSSIPAHVSNPPVWPYTLDYHMPHDCGIPPCPTKSYPGVWEVPMVMWEDMKGGRCAMADACTNPTDARGVYDMLVKNFKRHYTTNRAPFGMFYHYAWFTHPHQREGFLAFVDAVLKLPDVYFVTNTQMIEWMRDPVPLTQLSSYRKWQCGNPDAKVCNKPRKCSYRFRSDERQFPTCSVCPEKYPWLESYDSLHVTM